MKISIATAAFNQSLCDIPWLDTALKNSNVYEIIVCDNSTLKNRRAIQPVGLGVTHISANGNKGLPIAHNQNTPVCLSDVDSLLFDDIGAPDCYPAAVAKQEECDWEKLFLSSLGGLEHPYGIGQKGGINGRHSLTTDGEDPPTDKSTSLGMIQISRKIFNMLSTE